MRVLKIWIDGRPIDLEDAVLCRGFYPVDHTREGRCRWTDGAARIALPAGAARITLRLADGAVPQGQGGRGAKGCQ